MTRKELEAKLADVFVEVSEIIPTQRGYDGAEVKFTVLRGSYRYDGFMRYSCIDSTNVFMFSKPGGSSRNYSTVEDMTAGLVSCWPPDYEWVVEGRSI